MTTCLIETPYIKYLLSSGKFSKASLSKALESIKYNKRILKSGQRLNEDLSNIEAVSISDINDELLILKSIASNKKEDINSGINSFVDKLNRQLAKITDTIDKFVIDKNNIEASKTAKSRLFERKRELKEQLDGLKSQLTDAAMNNVATSQLKSVRKVLENTDLTSDELADVGSTLDMFTNYFSQHIDEIKRTVDTYDENGEVVTIDSDIYIDAKNLQSEAVELKEKLTKLIFSKIAENASQLIDIGITAEDIEVAKVTSDVNWWTANFRTLGAINNKIVGYLTVFLKNINNKAKAKQDIYKKKLDVAFAKLALESPLYKQYGFDFMLEKDKDGKKTGSFINKYTYEFAAMRDMFEKKHKSGETTPEEKAAYRKYRKDSYDSYEVISAIESGNESELIALKNELVGKYGSIIGEEYYNQIYTRSSDFLLERDIAFENFTTQEQKDTWSQINDPRPYMNAIKNGTQYIHPKGMSMDFFNHIRSIPKEHLLSEEYKAMSEDAAYLQFYNTAISIVSDYVKAMPYSFVTNKGIKNNFIPVVLLNTQELLMKDGGFDNATERIVKKSLSFIGSKKGEDVSYVDINEVTGVKSLGVPVHYMMRPVKHVDGKEIYNPDIQNFDIMKVLNTVIPQVSKFQYQMEALSTIDIVKRAISEMSESGKDAKGKKLAIANGLKSIKESVNAAVESALGAADEAPEGNIKSIELMSKGEKEEIEYLKGELEGKIAIIEKKVQENAMSRENADIEIEKLRLNHEHQVQNKTRNFSFGQTIRSSIKYYTLKTLGFGTSVLTESFQAFTSVMIDSQGGRDYNFKDYLTGLKSVWDKKDRALRAIYQVQPQNELGQAKSKFEKAAMYMAEQQDILQKNAILTAMMKKTQIMTSSGELISLYNAYNENGEWKSELFSEQVNKDWNPNEDLSLNTRNSYYRFKDSVEAKQIQLFGAYGEDSTLKISRSTFGKALVHFKRWLGESYGARFDNKYDNILLGREVKGRWISLHDVFVDNGFPKTMRALFTGNMDGISTQDLELDAENMRRNMVEAYTIMALTATALIIGKAIAGDDDEEYHASANILLKLVSRTNQDLLYYVNPKDTAKLTENLFPALKLVSKDVPDLINAFHDTMDGKGVVESGIFKDMNKITKESIELSPANGLLKWYKLANEKLKD
jgi:hypothetical protein